jgi:hypothetical protein
MRWFRDTQMPGLGQGLFVQFVLGALLVLSACDVFPDPNRCDDGRPQPGHWLAPFPPGAEDVPHIAVPAGDGSITFAAAAAAPDVLKFYQGSLVQRGWNPDPALANAQVFRVTNCCASMWLRVSVQAFGANRTKVTISQGSGMACSS